MNSVESLVMRPKVGVHELVVNTIKERIKDEIEDPGVQSSVK